MADGGDTGGGCGGMMRRGIHFAVILAALALLLASGCVQDAPDSPSPSPVATVVALPSPASTATAAAPPVPAVAPTPQGNGPPLSLVIPTPTPTLEVSDPLPGPCEALSEGHQDKHFLHWTLDGSLLVLNGYEAIWALDLEGARLREVVSVETDSFDPFGYGFYADVSADGSRIVYSTCEYPLDDFPPGHESYYETYYETYPETAIYLRAHEINTANIDGTGQRRLTKNMHLDHYPAWSPDGTEIAFIGNRDGYYSSRQGFDLVIAPTEDFQNGERVAVSSGYRVGLYPPAWSPDGRHVAFIVLEELAGEDYRYERALQRALHTVKLADQSVIQPPNTVYRIGKTTAPPSWSPDGELAFAAVEGEEVVIYRAKPDGTGLREIWRSGPDGPTSPVSRVLWSPDGSEILFASDGVYVVGADGSSFRPLAPDLPVGMGVIRAAWSPDGSRIAIYYAGTAHPPPVYFRDRRGPSDVLLATVSRDGTDLRTHVGGHDSGDLRLLDPPRLEKPVDLAACSRGHVVPEPESNPGLVRDCEVMLSIRDRLAGGSTLNWNERTPIVEWEGVLLEFQPPRVVRLEFRGFGLDGKPQGEYALSGTLPPELGQLTELGRLDLAGNYLSGSIPPELGDLSKLLSLSLSGNFLTGPIPSELGKLTKLEDLFLSHNFLTGPLPPELAGLSALHHLHIVVNSLSGSIPSEMGALMGMEAFPIWSTRLSSCAENPGGFVRLDELRRCAE